MGYSSAEQCSTTACNPIIAERLSDVKVLQTSFSSLPPIRVPAGVGRQDSATILKPRIRKQSSSVRRNWVSVNIHVVG